MNPNVTILMYHAITFENGDSPGADAHYSVSKGKFESNLRQIFVAGMQCASVARILAREPRSNSSVALTFDDGHASNLVAAELIARAGGSADFFINPSSVGTPNYLDWSALKDMAASGMSIQSHGFHHRYLDDLSAADVRAELIDSKRAIEDNLGLPVTIFAPPGGRMAQDMAKLAIDAGYQAVCSSRVGLWRAGADIWDIPRLAVLASTSEAQFGRWIRQAPVEIFGRRARYVLLRSAKRLLGNQGYERLRQGLLRTPG
jgi:peptidoglycan/xylan/chitin deacetylase (PgdA/CDA1 family)